MAGITLQNPAPLPAGSRIREVDELKGWAMLLVLLYHSGGVLHWPNWLHGEVGVDIFVIISGFTLARNSTHISWKDFLLRRMLRIYPAYWIALGLYLVLSKHFYGIERDPLNLFLHVVGLHAFSKPAYFSDINDSFWFISLILLLYFVFLSVRRHLGDLATILGIGFLLGTVVTWGYLAADHGGAIGHLAVRIPSFFLGLVAGRLTSGEPASFQFTPVFAIGSLALAYLGFHSNIIMFYAFAAPALIGGFLFVRRSLERHPDGRFVLSGFALLGVYSYEIFLFHQPLIRDYNGLIWSRVLGVDSPSNAQLGVGLVLSLIATAAISGIVHHLVGLIFSRRRPQPALGPSGA
jgi:peptidoglycan/LPS O-acetylase OafA/YrhL